MKLLSGVFKTLPAILLFIPSAWAQIPDPLSFFPYAANNVWQYRDASTQEIVYRRHNDSVSIGADSNIYIRARYVPGQIRQERIDTAFSLFNMTFQPDYPRYKLVADSGDSWMAGFIPPEDTMRVTVTDIYQDYIFGVFTTIKVFTFVIHRPPPWQPFWLGDDHLASGFGLVFSFIEGGSAPYLSGAIIDGVHWGEPIVGVKETPNEPAQFSLDQNYPNPFNPLTTINFEVPQKSHVVLTVIDVLGQTVTSLVDEEKDTGSYSVQFEAKSLSSGVYFYRLEAGGVSITRKMIVEK